MARILVTGSRYWDNEGRMRAELIKAFNNLRGEPVLIHGGARGADTMAGIIWAENPGYGVEVYPAEWNRQPDGTYDKAAGFKRNVTMVNLGADICLAFFKTGEKNAGTTHCSNLAARAGIPVVEVWS